MEVARDLQVSHAAHFFVELFRERAQLSKVARDSQKSGTINLKIAFSHARARLLKVAHGLLRRDLLGGRPLFVEVARDYWKSRAAQL